MIGKIVGEPEVDRVRNGTGEALMCQVEFSTNDVRTAQFIPHAGDDIVPVKGTIVEVINDNGTLMIVASYDGILSVGYQGEREIYSSSNGKKRARVICHESGAVAIINAAQSISLLEAIESVTAALSTFAGACSSAASVAVVAAAAVTLQTNVTLAKAKLEQVLAKS
jgi:hypothetical protein